MPLSTDRNDPETVAWLDYCRAQNRQLSQDDFEMMTPYFIELYSELEHNKYLQDAH